jgi:PilZ domain
MADRKTLVRSSADLASLAEERRRSPRIQLQVPLFVRGKDPQGEQFIELGKTLDISGLGAFIASPRALELNGFVTLTIPAPSITSSGLVPAGMAPFQAKVTRQREAGDVYLAGVEFTKPLG